MIQFCEKLDYYMRKRKITGKVISERAGISLSGFSRLRRGEKKTGVTKTQFAKLCETLDLSEKEADELRDLYDFWDFSEFDRRCVDSILRIIKSKLVFESAGTQYKNIKIESVSGTANVRNLIFSAFDTVSGGGQSEPVFVLSQLNNTSLTEILRTVMIENPKLNVENFFSFRSSSVKGYYAENIMRFEKAVPLLFTCTNYSLSLDYTVDDPQDFSLIFFSDFMILIPDDMSYADVSVGDLFRKNRINLIDKYKSSYNLFKSVRKNFVGFESLRDLSLQAQCSRVSILEEYPCIKTVVDYDDLVENFGAGKAAKMWDIIMDIQQQYLNEKNTVVDIFTKDALTLFLERGMYTEFFAVGVPLKPDVLLRLIRRMKKLTDENGGVKFLMIDSCFLNFDSLVFLENKDNGSTMFDLIARENEVFRCCMTEPSIYLAVDIFFRYLQTSKYIYEKEDFLALLTFYERKYEALI